MATATVARPAQALRESRSERRDARSRPSISKRQITMDAGSEPASKRRRLAEPYVRTSEYILEKHKGKPPSVILHLHQNHFRFEGNDQTFPFDSYMRFVIDAIKTETLPHQMIEHFLSPNVPWYDGCLIMEVHNHRVKQDKDKNQRDSPMDNDSVKFSMHNYNPHITPSPMAPFPSQAAMVDDDDQAESSNAEMPAPERPKQKEGPGFFTVVLHPTEQSRYKEMCILAETPVEQLRGKKKSIDSNAPSSAQPPTPQLSMPPTPVAQTSRGPFTQSQKMCVDESDWYQFEADLLVASGPPLYLEPVDNPADADRVLEFLSDPLHQAKPPSSKTRKRTTAEVAADDAQAAETERRMLIMDERIKPAGTASGGNENQSTTASLGFTRFKTIEMVRQKVEEAERAKKEDEARAVMEKKQAEEQNAIAQNALAQKQSELQQQRRLQLMAQQQAQQQAQQAQSQAQAQAAQQAQNQAQTHAQQQSQPNQQSVAMQMRAEQLRAQQMRAQQAMLNAQAGHGHPQQNGNVPNQQQGFQQANQAVMPQSSPVVRNQTPLVNSSPMMPQGGFPLAQTSSQGAGSPPRPTSATMPNQMVRQVSQQQISRNATPHMAQGTPAMNQAMPNRQPTQTPRMQPGSPAASLQQGTPTSVSMSMQTPQMGNQTQFTPEQMAMIQQQRAMSQQAQQNGQFQAGSPPQNLTAEHISNIRNQLQVRHQQMRQAQQNGQHEIAARLQEELQRGQHLLRAKQMSLQQQMVGAAGQAGSPGAMQQPTPQMGHAHPQQQQQQQNQGQGNMLNLNQMSAQQQMQNSVNGQAKAQQLAQMRHQHQQQQVAQARQQVYQLINQYGGFQSIPQQAISQLPPVAQQLLRQQFAQQQAMRQQQVVRAQQAQQQQNAQGGGGGGGEQVPGSQPNPQYMQQLRNNQAMLAQAKQHMANQQQQQQAQQQGAAGAGGVNNMAMQSFTMPGMGGNAFGNAAAGQGGGMGGSGADLSPHFAAMQNAMNRHTSNGQGGGMQ